MRFLDRPLREDEIRVITERFYLDVFAYCRRHTKSVEDAQDAAQETFLRFIRSAPRYREQGKPLAFLLTIARNVCIDLGRVRAKDCVALNEECVAAAADGREGAADVRLALAGLPPDLREVLELRYDFGLNVQEVGAHLGVSRFAASRLISKALRLLGEELHDEGRDGRL